MLNNKTIVREQVAGHEVTLETGAMAKQANGSVLLKCGKLALLATATMSKSPKPGQSFFPLTVEFSEKMYASGKIPGGFFKREARPRVGATLTSRLIDRPLRPCFPNDFYNDVQIIVTVLSYDDTLSPEPFAIHAASAALMISDIPFNSAVSSVLVGYVNNEFIINPTEEQMKNSELDLVVAGTQDAILMVESSAKELSEEIIIDGISKAHDAIKDLVSMQLSLTKSCSKEKYIVPPIERNEDIERRVIQLLEGKIEKIFDIKEKLAVESYLNTCLEDVMAEFDLEESPEHAPFISNAFNTHKKNIIRSTIIQKRLRPDGRSPEDVRPIDIEVGLLANTHGSSLFTRGETQSLGVITLGTAEDEQLEDGLKENFKRNYFFHYNFPPYSVGETGMFNRTSRRELGHGALAERALQPVLPSKESFPYTIRIVSEILESNGSSSMASVCSGSLSLMDSGVPVSSGVSGIAMGLLMDDNGYTILSDIQGAEDHYGDMDFKVAGTTNGITALQLDIKISGLSKQILKESLEQAKTGRLHILQKMNEALAGPRNELSDGVPMIESISIPPSKIGMVIGSGGKMIRKIEEDTHASVYIEDGDSGEVVLSSTKRAHIEHAKTIILGLCKDVEKGDVYTGKVVRTTKFGAFVELLPGKDGLIHISKLSDKRIDRVEDVINVGESIEVKVTDIDSNNRISLTPVN